MVRVMLSDRSLKQTHRAHGALARSVPFIAHRFLSVWKIGKPNVPQEALNPSSL